MDPQVVILLKGLGAMLLGGVIGWEREVKDKPAGLRTHMYIAGVASFLVMLGLEVTKWYDFYFSEAGTGTDPIRILQAVVVGIGFIGGGVIMHADKSEEVENLTTAATILFVAVVGVAVAIDLWWVSIGMSVASVVLNRVGNIFKRKFI